MNDELKKKISINNYPKKLLLDIISLNVNVMKTKDFISKAKNIHEDKYDYSKVEYKDEHTKVRIVCKEHGEFLQEPNSHLNGRGCPKCGIISRSNKNKTKQNELFSMLNEKQKEYDYSLLPQLFSYKDKLKIICHKKNIFGIEHGIFETWR